MPSSVIQKDSLNALLGLFLKAQGHFVGVEKRLTVYIACYNIYVIKE